MAFNLNDFRNQFVNGGARPTQFEMQITWPDTLRSLTGITPAEQAFRFLCQASEIPGEKTEGISASYFGRKLVYAGDRQYAPLTVTILNDEDFKIHTALSAWKRGITGHDNTTSVFNGGIASGSYATDGVVTQFSRNEGGSAIHAYKFIGMWPTSISNIELNWGTNDSFETFSVEFNYQWWEKIDPATGTVL